MHLNVYGLLTPSDLIGHTIWDLDLKMNKMWQDNATQITLFEDEVAHTGKPVIQTERVWLNAKGFVWSHHMSKIPVFGRDNKICAILSLGEDLTATLSFEKLYKHYCYFYKDKHCKVEKFLQHIGVHDYFSSLPTNAETLILVAKKMLVHNKLVAQHLNISLGTVESHINNLNQKTPSLLTVLTVMSNK